MGGGPPSWVARLFERDGLARVHVPDAGPLVIALAWRAEGLSPAGARLRELAAGAAGAPTA